MNFSRRLLVFASLLSLVAIAGGARFKLLSSPGEEMTIAAEGYLKTLTAEQKAKTQMEFDAAQRVDWHFIPKPTRKGLQIKEMDEPQRKAAHVLFRSALSQIGYDKATKIMELESLLAELEKDRKGGNIRDPHRYYFTLFGKPTLEGTWGLSIEGHHLSFNFVIAKGKVTSSTPTFYATNPATVKSSPLPSIPTGQRVLADEEQFAFDLLASLSAEQKKTALIADKPPAEIRGAGEVQPPQTKPEGIACENLNDDQKKLLKKLIVAYANNVPEAIARERLEAIEKADHNKVHFAWAGANEPGFGHYYRVQGPTFLIEFVNVQPDAAGNPANHIHCVWRNMEGDFGLPIGGK